jgi:cytochrome c
MKNCADTIRLSSQIPGYARDSHGNLALQTRPLGAVEGVDTSSPGAAPASPPRASAVASATGAALAQTFACTACHGVSSSVIGPAFRDVARKYSGAPDAERALIAKLRAGGSGTWGAVAMPPQPQLAPAQAQALVHWILGGAK